MFLELTEKNYYQFVFEFENFIIVFLNTLKNFNLNKSNTYIVFLDISLTQANH